MTGGAARTAAPAGHDRELTGRGARQVVGLPAAVLPFSPVAVSPAAVPLAALSASGSTLGPGPAAAARAASGVPAVRVVERRLENSTAATMMITAPMATPARSPWLSLYLTTLVATSSETRFMTLSSGLMAGPAVSLNGSPTVSPMMV